jgi:sugar lactone lactonase YvrE
MAVFVWACAGREKLNAAVPISPMNSRRFMPAPKDHFAAVEPSKLVIDGVNCGPDGVRCDVNGNVWASSNAGRHVGYNGVTVWTPAGKLIGRIRLPEVCGNICFGGPKRNRLFMAGSQSLYAVYTATQGAGPG